MESPDAQIEGTRAVKLVQAGWVAGALLTGVLCRPALAASDAALVGTVRDARGTPQMGALIELLGRDATLIARAFTDDHGRYLLRTANAGVYHLRVSAAFFLPFSKPHLVLRAGMQTVADLTLSALYQAGTVLPAERPTAASSPEDWRWVLRSTANRPLLRLAADDADTNTDTAFSGSASSAERVLRPAFTAQMLLSAGDGSFGQGGAGQTVTLSRTAASGDVSVLKASLGGVSASGAPASMAVGGEIERSRPMGGGSRLLVSFASNPGVTTGAGSGYSVLRTAATETFVLGDAVKIDAGTLFTAERLLGNQFQSSPYLRVAVAPSTSLSLEYHYASDRVLQRSEDLDEINLPVEVLSDSSGRPLPRRANHQEFALTRHDDKQAITLAVFHDRTSVERVQGGGGLPEASSLLGLRVITDPGTGTLRLGVNGFSSNGARLAWERTFNSSLSARMEGCVGRAATAPNDPLLLETASAHLSSRVTGAVRASMEFASQRRGTQVDTVYRWQPRRTLTAVDEFDAALNEAYLGVDVRQRLWTGRHLKGLDAVLMATNLLAEGYEPVIGPDGQTLYLAQVPRALQGGLALRF